jgi:hypothetical protein
MTDMQILDQTSARAMTADEEALARSFYDAIQKTTNESARSLQAAGHRIGVSDLGFCSERVRRSLAGQTPEPVDKTKAFVGTALGDHIEAAFVAEHPEMIRQSEVEIVLVGDTGTYVLNGHPDLIDPRGKVWDVKTVFGLNHIQRTGPSQQQQFQRHCYAKAAYRAGLFNDGVSLSDVTVGNVWFDRSAEEPVPYIHSEPYDERVVEMATSWIDDVVYAYLHDEPARKEPPIAMCAKACGFYLDCRAGQGLVGGLIDDTDALAAVDMFNTASELEREAKRMKNQAKVHLNGVEGSTGTYSISWSKVAGGEVSYHRDPYLRLSVRKLR